MLLCRFKGRTTIHEVMVFDKPLRKLINEGASMDEVKQAACDAGMNTLADSAKELVLNGVTTVDQAMKATYNLD